MYPKTQKRVHAIADVYPNRKGCAYIYTKTVSRFRDLTKTIPWETIFLELRKWCFGYAERLQKIRVHAEFAPVGYHRFNPCTVRGPLLYPYAPCTHAALSHSAHVTNMCKGNNFVDVNDMMGFAWEMDFLTKLH